MRIIKYKGDWYSKKDVGLFRVMVDENSDKLNQPPAVVRMYVNTNKKHGTAVTPMALNGWDKYLKKLNGDKFETAVHYKLAMFNGQAGGFYEGGDEMSSLMFAGNLVRAVPVGGGWYRVITLDWNRGPPKHMPTYEDDPISVQEFTVINRNGVLKRRYHGRLYYPVVSRKPVYMYHDQLEPVSENMVTRIQD